MSELQGFRHHLYMYNTNEIVTKILMHEKLYMERKNVHTETACSQRHINQLYMLHTSLSVIHVCISIPLADKAK